MTSTTPGTEGSSPGFEPSLLPCTSMVLFCCPWSAENSLLTLGLCPRWSLCLEPMSDRKLCGLPPDVSQVSAQKSLWNGYSCMSYLPILSLTLSVPLPSFISSNTCHYLFISSCCLSFPLECEFYEAEAWSPYFDRHCTPNTQNICYKIKASYLFVGKMNGAK